MSRFVHARRGGWLIPACLISFAALVVAGCGGGSSTKANAGDATAAAPAVTKPVGAPGATVRFLTPRAGSTVTGSTVRVRVRVTGFTLDANDVGRAARQGFGHLHFSLDRGRYDTPHYAGANGAQAAKLGVQGKYSPSVTPTITYRHVRPGRHVLVVYLANNDHSLTGVTARVTFTVRKPPPPPPPAPPVATTPRRPTPSRRRHPRTPGRLRARRRRRPRPSPRPPRRRATAAGRGSRRAAVGTETPTTAAGPTTATVTSSRSRTGPALEAPAPAGQGSCPRPDQVSMGSVERTTCMPAAA